VEARNIAMKTFVVIKPDAIRRGLVGEIVKRFEQKGFTIERMELRYKNEEWCRLQYSQFVCDCGDDCVNKEIFYPLVHALAGESLIGMVLKGPDAVFVVRRMVGATDSTQAEPGTIRGDFGSLPVRENLVHACDDEDRVDTEIRYFFDEETDCETSPNQR